MANGTLHSAYLFGKELRSTVTDGQLDIRGHWPKRGSESYVKLCGANGGPHTVLALITHISRSAFQKSIGNDLVRLLINSDPRWFYADAVERCVPRFPNTQLHILTMLGAPENKGKKKVGARDHHICPTSRGGAQHRDNLYYLSDHIHRPYHALFQAMYPHEAMLMLLPHMSGVFSTRCMDLLTNILLDSQYPFPKMYKEGVLRE